MSHASGDVISGTLRLLRPIAKGGMGCVWRAQHLVLGTEVAVKFLASGWSPAPGAETRFLREAKMTARVTSPHVVRALDGRRSEADEPYLVLELLHGETLEEKVERSGPLPLPDVVAIVEQGSAALEAIHAVGILHRDVKPDNVFLVGGREPCVKLLDFGIARPLRDEECLEIDRAAAGTPGFLAPEQVLVPHEIDRRADFFSLAAVAYYALTGDAPFRADDHALVVPAAPPSGLRPGIAGSIDRWFSRALARDASDRFPSAPAMAMALREAFEGGTESTSESSSERSSVALLRKTAQYSGVGLRPVFSVLSAALLCGAACRGNSDVSFEIAVPSSIVGQAEWFEIGAYEGASCAAVGPMLRGGVPDGFTTRVAFRRSVSEPPRIGQIPRASYAFGAVARAADCGVLAVGCQEADVGDTDKVTVQLQTTDGSLGVCPQGTTCQSARCVPANDNTDPSIGAKCSLELVGAGPVTNSLGGQGTLISAPAVAVTETGFLVAYREIDTNGTEARLTVLPVDLGGGAGTAVRATLRPRCSDSQEVDGLGLFTRGTDALVALTKSPCGDLPELEVVNFTTQPLAVGNLFVTPSPTQARLQISPASTVAVRGPDRDLVAFVDGDAARIATLRPGGISAPAGSFGATSGVTGAWAAASDRVLALLAAGAPSVALGDGGAPVDAGSGQQLRLVMADVNTDAAAFDAATNTPVAPITFPGEWGAVAARGTRVIVLSDGSGPGRSVTVRAFDLGRSEASSTTGFSVEGGGKVSTGAVAMQGDRAYFAALREGGIALAVFGDASLTPTPLRSLFFAQEPRIPSVTGVRDGRVAIAATDTRVIVAWTNSKVLGANDYTGGYAVFACTQ